MTTNRPLPQKKVVAAMRQEAARLGREAAERRIAARNLAADEPFIIDDGTPDPLPRPDVSLRNPVYLTVEENVVLHHLRGLAHNRSACYICGRCDALYEARMTLAEIRKALA